MKTARTVCAAIAALVSVFVLGFVEPASAQRARGGDIVDVAKSAGSFETLLAAVEAAGLTDALRGEGPFTVFAPTDAAFERLGDDAITDLLRPSNRPKLRAILAYHVVPERLTSSDIVQPGARTTLLEQPVAFGFTNGSIEVGSAGVRAVDINASNGVIHVIDEVLIPDLSAIESQISVSPAERCRELIALAIERGAPLFNDGSPTACAAVYEVAAEALLELGSEAIPQDATRELAGALRTARDRHTSPTNAAWALRRALDRTFLSLGESMSRTAQAENAQPDA
ncbi:MAG: fasciclin domain-containing protein [Planctomycetota bacterium]